jgi:hypothetical protein
MASDIHAIAVAAEAATEQLATALASEGASEQTIAAISQCAEILRQVVEALGRGQEETGDEEPASLDQATAETHQAMQKSANNNA